VVVGTSPRRSRNEFTFGSINEAIVIRGVTIAPRDYVLADESGVVVVPAARIDEVLALADRIAAQEAKLEAQAINDAVTSWDQV
jgi:regulator of RNase E activity RraA